MRRPELLEGEAPAEPLRSHRLGTNPKLLRLIEKSRKNETGTEERNRDAFGFPITERRDVYKVHGNLNKARRAVELARKEIDRQFAV